MVKVPSPADEEDDDGIEDDDSTADDDDSPDDDGAGAEEEVGTAVDEDVTASAEEDTWVDEDTTTEKDVPAAELERPDDAPPDDGAPLLEEEDVSEGRLVAAVQEHTKRTSTVAQLRDTEWVIRASVHTL